MTCECFAAVTVLPILDDGVGYARIGVVVGRGLARLHKQLGVGNSGGRLNLHEHHLFEVHIDGVPAGINWLPEVVALVELKLEGEGTEAPLSKGVRVFVPESQRRVSLLGKSTGKGDVDIVLPGNDHTLISRCDVIHEDHVVIILLKTEEFKGLQKWID